MGVVVESESVVLVLRATEDGAEHAGNSISMMLTRANVRLVGVDDDRLTMLAVN